MFRRYSFREWMYSKDTNSIIVNKPDWWYILNGFVRMFTLFNYTINTDEDDDV